MIKALPGTSYGREILNQLPIDDVTRHIVEENKDIELSEANIVSIAWELGLSPQVVEDSWRKAKCV